MKTPKICAVITTSDADEVRQVEPFADMFEVRIDIIGKNWRGVAQHLRKPWIATNRRKDEGGAWQGSEKARIDELLSSFEFYPAIIDIELATDNLTEVVSCIKPKAQCLISLHDFNHTPPLAELRLMVAEQIAMGADICKIVTMAQVFEDNLTMLRLLGEFPQAKLVAFAMGALGCTSRILSPLAGGEYVYASMAAGNESASGQVTAAELRKVYEVLKL